MRPAKKVNINPHNTLNIFDLDDTLFVSDSVIRIVKNKRVIRELDTHSFLTYVLKPGEAFDFSDFKSGRRFHDTAQPIKNMLNTAKATLAGRGRTIIVTARADLMDKKLFLKKFRDCNFPIDRVYIERAGNIPGASATAKAIIIRRYLEGGLYNRVKMWDDSAGNLKSFLQLRKEFPEIEFIAYKVDPKRGLFGRFNA